MFPPLTNCIRELKSWLEANYLKFNSDKTEVILIGSKAVVLKLSCQLMELDGDLIVPSSKVRNLGVLIDLTFDIFDPLSVSRMLKLLYMPYYCCYTISIRLL